MKLSLIVAVLSLSLAPFALACSGADAGAGDNGDGDEVTEDEANAARVAPGDFKLYDEPRATPDPTCDVHTKLSLSATGGSRAKLEEAVGGPCEIAVFPNPREYRLRLIETSCGSQYYAGSFRKAGKKHSVLITDHRARTCRDIVPAKIIVEETRPGDQGPFTTKRYSNDLAGGTAITADGTLESVMGIGGESTGRAILTQQGSYELVLDGNERGDFIEGRRARVKGTLTFLSGVETRNRPAIKVQEILTCPNSGAVFNCMPPTAPGNTACGADRSWIQASCPGVSYLD